MEVEEPLLLDPCKREDVVLLTFMGKEVLCSSANEDDQVRVKVSRKIYNMTNKYIETDRAKAWEEVTKTWTEYKASEISRSVCLRRLKDAVDRKAPFSACAISCVKSIVDEDIKAELDLEL